MSETRTSERNTKGERARIRRTTAGERGDSRRARKQRVGEDIRACEHTAGERGDSRRPEEAEATRRDVRMQAGRSHEYAYVHNNVVASI